MGHLLELSPARACFCCLVFTIFLFLLAVVGLLLLLRAKKAKINKKKKLLNDVQLPFPCYIFMLVVQPAPRNSRTQLHRLELLFLNVTVITLAEAC